MNAAIIVFYSKIQLQYGFTLLKTCTLLSNVPLLEVVQTVSPTWIPSCLKPSPDCTNIGPPESPWSMRSRLLSFPSEQITGPCCLLESKTHAFNFHSIRTLRKFAEGLKNATCFYLRALPDRLMSGFQCSTASVLVFAVADDGDWLSQTLTVEKWKAIFEKSYRALESVSKEFYITIRIFAYNVT